MTTERAESPSAVTLPQLVRTLEGIAEYSLPNGLQILLRHQVNQPIVVNLVVRAGSRHENYGETGLAHVLEHMVYLDPLHDGDMPFMARLENHSLMLNAMTHYDFTCYFASFAADSTLYANGIDMFCRRMADTLQQQTFIALHRLDVEKRVLRNEAGQDEDNRELALRNEVLAAMFKWHNYGKDISGAQSDVAQMDAQKLLGFYRRFYRPDNACLIVTGGFDQRWLLDLIALRFGSVPRPAGALERFCTDEPRQEGEREVVLRRVGGQYRLAIAYRGPGARHPDAGYMALLTRVLAARLQGKLGLSLCTLDMLAEASVIWLDTEASSEELINKLRQLLLKQAESIGQISVYEFDDARLGALQEWQKQFDDYVGLSQILGAYFAWGDWRLLFWMRDMLNEASLAGLQHLADGLLMAANCTIGSVIPVSQPLPVQDITPRDPAQWLADYQLRASSRASTASPTSVPGLRLHEVELAIQRTPLVSGVADLQYVKFDGQDSASNMLKLQLNLGVADDLPGQYAVATLLAQQVFLHFSSPTFGFQLEVRRRSALQLEFLLRGEPYQLESGVVRLLRRLRGAGQLSIGELDRLRTHALYTHKRQASSSMTQREQARLELKRLTNPYPEDHPLYLPSDDEWLRRLLTLDLAAQQPLLKQLPGLDGIRIALSGSINPDVLIDRVKSEFGDWRAAIPPKPLALDKEAVRRPRQTQVLRLPDQRNALMLNRINLPLDRAHPDFPALAMAFKLCVGDSSSRVWQQVRQQQGLSYTPAYGILQQDPGYPYAFAEIHTSFAPANRHQVEQAFDQVFCTILEQGFSEEALQAGRQQCSNQSWYWRWQQQQQLLSSNQEIIEHMLTKPDLLESPAFYDAKQQVSLDQVNAAFRHYLDPAYMTRVLAGTF